MSAKDTPIAFLDTDNKTVRFRFTSSYNEDYGSTRSEGLLFLEMVTIENPTYHKKSGLFASSLPFGLRIDMAEDDIVSLLGEPSHASEFMGGVFLTYRELIKGLDVIIKLDIKNRDIIFIRITPADL